MSVARKTMTEGTVSTAVTAEAQPQAAATEKRVETLSITGTTIGMGADRKRRLTTTSPIWHRHRSCSSTTLVRDATSTRTVML